MGLLPEPTSTFTIPSIYDDTVLGCRVYHPPPAQRSPTSSSSSSSDPDPTSLHKPDSENINKHHYTKKGALLAHPYAPLGGCSDDPILTEVVAELLREGWIVCVFNFRGAGNSGGRTSWSGRGEVGDMSGVVGWMVWYLDGLEVDGLSTETETESGTGTAAEGEGKELEIHSSDAFARLEPITTAVPLTIEPHSFPFSPTADSAESTTPSGAQEVEEKTQTQNQKNSKKESNTLLLLGGYSYGSHITTLLPPTPELLKTHFPYPPEPGSAQAEIILRARHCAEERNRSARAAAIQRDASKSRRSGVGVCSPSGHHGVVMGGDEDLTRQSRRRTSRDSSRRSFSLDLERLGGEGFRQHLGRKTSSSSGIKGKKEGEKEVDREGGKEKEKERRRRRSYNFLAGHHHHHDQQQEKNSGGNTPTTLITTTTPSSSSSAEEAVLVPAATPPENPITVLQLPPPADIAYLLISPLLPPLSTLATLNLSIPFFHTHTSHTHSTSTDTTTEKLRENPTLAVYGTNDIFTSYKKLEKWAARLSTIDKGRRSKFTSATIQGAGHFWIEPDALAAMKRAVREWVRTLPIASLEREDADMVRT